jgi:hypothetical protein
MKSRKVEEEEEEEVEEEQEEEEEESNRINFPFCAIRSLRRPYRQRSRCDLPSRSTCLAWLFGCSPTPSFC